MVLAFYGIHPRAVGGSARLGREVEKVNSLVVRCRDPLLAWARLSQKESDIKTLPKMTRLTPIRQANLQLLGDRLLGNSNRTGCDNVRSVQSGRITGRPADIDELIEETTYVYSRCGANVERCHSSLIGQRKRWAVGSR